MGTVAQVSAGFALALFLTSRVVASTAVDTVRVDLNLLIDSAARSHEQFAVNIPRSVSSATWCRSTGP